MNTKITNRPKFICIPSEVLFDEELTPSQRNLFGFIFYLDKNKGCYATNKNIAELMNMSEWEVSRGVSKLRRLGYIEVNRADEGYRHIKLASQYIDLRKSLCKNAREGGLPKTARVSADNPMKLQKKNTPLNTSGIKSLSRTDYSLQNNPRSSFSRDEKEPSAFSSAKMPSHFSKKIHSLLEYWNNLPNVPKHKTKTTKVYNQSCYKLDLLCKGKLGSLVQFDEVWLTRHNIPLKWANEQWSEEQVKTGMNLLSNLYTEGYWPKDKSKLPRQLSRLIYSPESMSSWFLMICKVGVKKISELVSNGQSIPAPLEEELISAFEQIKTGGLSIAEKSSARQLGYDLVKLRNALSEKNEKLKHLFGQRWNDTYLIQKFISWLSTIHLSNWPNISPRMFTPGTEFWSSFISHIGTSVGEKDLVNDETLTNL